MRERHGFADGLGGLDEVHAVIIVLLDARSYRKHIRVEDDVFRRQTGLFGQKLVGARADFHLALIGIRLPDLIKGHDDNRRTVIVDEPSLLEKLLLAFLQRNGIDDRFALHAFQAGLDDLELDESIMTGTRAMSGSAAMRFRNSTIAFSESIRPSSMLMSMICAPFSTWSRATASAAV